MNVITKSEAKKIGLNYYFTGKPCRNGHISKRLVREHHSRDSSCFKCRVNILLPEAIELRAWIKRHKKQEMLKSEIQERLYEKFRREHRDAELMKTHSRVIGKFARSSLQRVERDWKGGRSKGEEACGYSFDELTKRIESQFKDGMSWDNRSEWHIDHIKPIKAFLDEGITDPAIINALDNLQPLWAHENISKGAKYNASQ